MVYHLWLLLAPASLVAAGPHSLGLIPRQATSVISQPHTYGPLIRHTYNSSLATTSSSTDLVTPQPLANDAVLVKVLDSAVSITQAVCTTGGPLACAATGLSALFGIFFLGYLAVSSRDTAFIINLAHPPLPDCDAVCRLQNEEPEGDWRMIGNATLTGVFHEIHYRRSGNYTGLRAIQMSNGGLGRREEKNSGGVVIDYNWNTNNHANYNSFGSTSAMSTSFADSAISDMANGNTVIECQAFEDSGGVLDTGLITAGWNNQAFQWTEDGEFEGVMNECESDLLND